MTRGGNMRGAPLFLRPSVVLGLVEGVEAIRKGLVQVPVAPIKLVDVPRRSEDPRLAKANDDSTPSGWVAPPVASEPEDWPDAPLPDHADPDLDRPEPVEDTRPAPTERVRKPRAAASIEERDQQLVAGYLAGTEVAALAEQFRLKRWYVRWLLERAGVYQAKNSKSDQSRASTSESAAPPTPEPEPAARVDSRSGPEGGSEKPRRAARRQSALKPKPCGAVQVAESAPVEPDQLDRPDTPVQVQLPMHPLPQVADQPLPEPSAPSMYGPGFYSEAATKRRLQDAGRHRARVEQSEIKAKRIARRAERAAEVDAATAEFAAALERVRARRAEGVEVIVRKSAPPLNAGARLADAIRLRDARKAQTAAPPKRPIERALSREECPRCGIAGTKGCEHQLPFMDTIDPASLGHSNSGPRV